MTDLKNMVISLAQANGTSGAEDEILDKIEEYVPDNMKCERDRFGNLTATLDGSGKTFLLDAHADRIGLIVTAIEDGGFLRAAKCGGMDARVLAAQDVTIWGREPVYGVIISTPPHLSKDADGKKAVDFDGILVDVGMSREKAEKLISLGDRITVRCPVSELMNDRISGAALDDRAGCAVIIRAAELIAQSENYPTVKLLFSAQEETGGDGAITGSFNLDADECIAVDVSFADAPDMPSNKVGKLGKGPMIGIAPVLNYDISLKLQSISREKNIPYQLELMGDSTGTNADHIAISKGGIKTGLISIPQRNMHTGVEIVDVDDIENCAKLIAEYVLGGGIDD
ncbi:MAG: M20/M25/M40 family metallo-hydrolase [Clostridia bacterium]|nr:M20/M25/M40 family metallo-hydrolase [Clostridia bacterium]